MPIPRRREWRRPAFALAASLALAVGVVFTASRFHRSGSAPVAALDGASNAADGATWLTRDGFKAWQMVGPSVESTSALDAPHTHYYLSGYTITWGLTNLVQGWVDQRYPNYGVLLVPTSSFSEAYASAEASWVPNLQVPLDLEGAKKMIRVIEALEDSDDVQDVFANGDIPDDVLAALDEE